jgi:hypothetical protein
MSIFANLPLELVNIILSYNNVIRCRNGKYINQIVDNDSRKELLERIPIKREWYWYDTWERMTTVVLHINFTKYYSIDYRDFLLTISTSVHSGIDYQDPYPGDLDESTQLLDVVDILIE